MQHIFITNPVAGRGKAESEFTAKIIETSKRLNVSYQVHRTISVGDGERFVKKILLGREGDTNEIMRFYACGGDGTLNEVVNGAYGQPNTEVAIIPTGTGNDFVRNFNSDYKFLDIEKQINGQTIEIDLIKYKGKTNIEYIEGDLGERYCINMINMGLDCEIVKQSNEFNKNTMLWGRASYFAAVAKALIKKKAIVVKVYFEDGTSYEGKALLLAIGNGKFYGAGFKGAPHAEMDDGLVDVGIIRDLSRRNIVPLIGKYRKGTHLEIRDAFDKLIYKRCRSLTLHLSEKSEFCVDGEIKKGGALEITVIPQALRLSLPRI